jgi:nucleoside 2-deoxyribosyltransferase
MIHVAGGCYVELCVEPLWDQLFGSGLRAAAAISELSDAVELTTYCADKERPNLETLAASFDISVHVNSSPQTIRFSYYHGLSEPRIRPPLQLVKKTAPQTVTAPHVLRFGLFESDLIVHGERVVYDPQDAYNPRPFAENGSTANHLAIVANLWETRALSGDVDLNLDHVRLGRLVLKAQGAEVVVIKRGSLGATVITETEAIDIPVYRTKSVWPIGSGDVFAGTFAYYWASESLTAEAAAHQASLATAYYCESKVLPIPKDIGTVFERPPVVPGEGGFPASSKQVYVAAPFFTMAERWMLEQSCRHLKEQGLKVFSPYHDVGYGPAARVVPADIDGLNKSDLVYAMLDGLDTGTVFEVGHARAMGKPVIAFVQTESEDDLKMLEGTGCEIVRDFVSSIYRATWAAIAL